MASVVLGASLHAIPNYTYILMDANNDPLQGSSSSNNNNTSLPNDAAAQIELAEYLMFDEEDHHQGSPIIMLPLYQMQDAPASAVAPAHPDYNVVMNYEPDVEPAANVNAQVEGSARREETSRIAFRVKSEENEILEDGFKWRKYGKKSLKNSPNPRNYFKCSSEGCTVKKRIERDREDPSYVITTYEGKHNHTSPSLVYYTSQDANTGRFYVAGCQMPPAS